MKARYKSLGTLCHVATHWGCSNVHTEQLVTSVQQTLSSLATKKIRQCSSNIYHSFSSFSPPSSSSTSLLDPTRTQSSHRKYRLFIWHRRNRIELHRCAATPNTHAPKSVPPSPSSNQRLVGFDRRGYFLSPSSLSMSLYLAPQLPFIRTYGSAAEE